MEHFGHICMHLILNPTSICTEALGLAKALPRNEDQEFSKSFKWTLCRSKVNKAIYCHKRVGIFQSSKPLFVPIDGCRCPAKIRFALHHSGLDGDKGVNTTLDSFVTLPPTFMERSVTSNLRLSLTAGAFESDGKRDGKLLKQVTVESPLNVQTVRLPGFISHQQLKSSESTHIRIKVGCRIHASDFRFEIGPAEGGFIVIDKV